MSRYGRPGLFLISECVDQRICGSTVNWFAGMHPNGGPLGVFPGFNAASRPGFSPHRQPGRKSRTSGFKPKRGDSRPRGVLVEVSSPVDQAGARRSRASQAIHDKILVRPERFDSAGELA